VVIGILIALQINTWNQERINRKKERSYLVELKASLESDQLQIQKVLDFNVAKDSIVVNLMRIFDSQLTNEERFEIIQSYATPFTEYEFFEPNSTTWNNLLSAENINLINDRTLRTYLTKYYAFDYDGSVQERIKIMNRKIIDENFPKFFTREYAKRNLNLETDLPGIEEFDHHRNQTFLSDLFGVRFLIQMQSEGLRDIAKEIDHMITLMDQNI
jgi:hypothetical protein